MVFAYLLSSRPKQRNIEYIVIHFEYISANFDNHMILFYLNFCNKFLNRERRNLSNDISQTYTYHLKNWGVRSFEVII